MKKLVVQLVTWNGAKYIPHLFDSLKKQTCLDWQLVVLDNASSDGTGDVIKKELAACGFSHTFIESADNTGFAGGHNRLFRDYDSEYVVLLNQDMFLMPDCFERMVHYMDVCPNVAAVSPRLMKWNFQLMENNGLKRSFSTKIDSLGLQVFRSRRVVELFPQQEWQDVREQLHVGCSHDGHQNEDKINDMEVFGVSGALPMLRRSALRAVAFPDGTFFDEYYHAYKEDVDLAFRLRSAGFDASVLLDAVAYHDRSAAGPKKLSDIVASKNKIAQSEWVKYHSYKNHLMTLYKNERWQNFLLDLPFILWYELKKFVWFLLFDRTVLGGLKVVLRAKGTLREKRNAIIQQRNITWREIRSWYA